MIILTYCAKRLWVQSITCKNQTVQVMINAVLSCSSRFVNVSIGILGIYINIQAPFEKSTMT